MAVVTKVVRRRAIVLFLPEDIEREVDAIRHRWDPAMAGRIDAHLTVIHDVTDVEQASTLLAEIAARIAGFEITLTGTACWGPAKWGIYLGIEDHHGGVQALHDALVDIENPRWLRTPFRPHVTLVHGRTVSEAIAEEAWAELTDYAADRRGRIDAVHLVESRPGGWVTIDAFDLVLDPTPAAD